MGRDDSDHEMLINLCWNKLVSVSAKQFSFMGKTSLSAETTSYTGAIRGASILLFGK